MNKVLLETLQGRKSTQIPIWFMRQAGRYLPEYMEVRKNINSFLELCYNPSLACNITLQPIKRYNFDGAILFADILVIPDALGQQVQFIKGKGPQLSPIKNQYDLNALKKNKHNISKKLNNIYQTVSLLSNKLTESPTTLIGFAGSPYTVSCYMIEGSGSKEFSMCRTFMKENLKIYQELIELLIETTSEYLMEQIKAGAEVIQLFDSWAGTLNYQEFKEYVINPTREIVKIIKNKFPNIKIIGFPKGAGQNIIEYIEQTQVDCIGLDQTFNPQWVRSNLLEQGVIIQGNLDNTYLISGGEVMNKAIHNILENYCGYPFIFNLGHGILPTTDPKNVQQALDVIRAYKAC